MQNLIFYINFDICYSFFNLLNWIFTKRKVKSNRQFSLTCSVGETIRWDSPDGCWAPLRPAEAALPEDLPIRPWRWSTVAWRSSGRSTRPPAVTGIVRTTWTICRRKWVLAGWPGWWVCWSRRERPRYCSRDSSGDPAEENHSVEWSTVLNKEAKTMVSLIWWCSVDGK